MFRSSKSIVALVAGTLAAAALAQPKGDARPARFGFGTPATPAQIAGWDIDVRPDGHGLPPGRGTVAQGQALYDAQCASCHGTFGESTDYMAIAGGVGTLASDQPIRNCCTGCIFGTPTNTLLPSFERYELLGVIQS